MGSVLSGFYEPRTLVRVFSRQNSQSGHTKSLIQKCKIGAEKENVEIKIIKALDAELVDIIWADGIIFGTPENFGSMSGGLKNFFDRTYYPAREIEINKPYALLISCETDGSGTERQIQTITTGYVLKKVLDTIIVKESEFNPKIVAVEELGQTFAAGLVLGIF